MKASHGNPVGRPTKITHEVVRKLEEAFRNDFTVEEACRYAKISKSTYYEEAKRNEEFSDEMRCAQDYAILLAKKAVVRHLKKGDDPYFALRFLERRQPEQYSLCYYREPEQKEALTTVDIMNEARRRAMRYDHPKQEAIVQG